MKKFVLLSAAAAFALAYSAKAVTIVGTTSDGFEKVNISFTVKTNADYTLKGDTYTYKTGTAKAGNKQLLALFATWSTNDTSGWTAAGAQLIFDFYSDEVCVADKSGTNILLYTDDGVDTYFDYEPDYGDGAYTETYVDNTPGKDNGTDYDYGFFELYNYDGNNAHYIDVYGYGQNTEKYSESWTATTDKWSESDSLKTTGNGELAGITASVTSASIKGSGHGND